jgi:hypothetical protein
VRDRRFENQKELSPECWLHATELGLYLERFKRRTKRSAEVSLSQYGEI